MPVGLHRRTGRPLSILLLLRGNQGQYLKASVSLHVVIRMQEGLIPPKLLRRARRFNLYLILGMVIVVSALGLGFWEAQTLQNIHNLEVAGSTNTPEYTQARQIEDILRIITPTWTFVGLALLTFGIGMSIVVIIFNLTGAGRDSMAAYMQSFPGSKVPVPPQPRYAKTFPKLMTLGLILVTLNFLFALFGGIVAAGLFDFRYLGFTSETWTAFTEVLRTPQRPGALSFIVLGIGLSLATIVHNLRSQARILPRVVGALRQGKPAEVKTSLVPKLPKFPFALLVGGFVIALLASYPTGFIAALARADIVGGSADAVITQRFALTQALFPVIAVTGLVTMLAGIVYWLLLIVQGLRDQRHVVLRMGANLASAQPVPLEQPMWPERVAGYLAGGGILTLLMLFVLAGYNIWIRWEVMALQPQESGAGFHTLVFLRDFLTVLIPNLRFTGMALVMIGIGITLGAIIVNLRGMGMIMPGTMSKILQSRQKDVAPAPAIVDEGDVESRSHAAMTRFPKKLLAPLLLGSLILISTTFPLVIPMHMTLQLQKRDADSLGQTDVAAQTAVDMNVLGAYREPWNFIGMGLVFFAIGKFFGTIIGFVQARRVVIADTCGSLVSRPEPEEAAASNSSPHP